MFALLSRVLPLALAAAPALAVAAESNPIPAPQMREGDSWVMERTVQRGTTGFNQSREAMKVQRVESDDMVLGVKVDGSPTDYEDHAIGLDWSRKRVIDGKEAVTNRPFSFPMTIGKTWTAEYTDKTQHGAQISAQYHETYKAVGWEDVTTPAGTFHALRIQATTSVDAHMAASNVAAGGASSTLNNASAASQVTHLPERNVHEVWREDIYYAPEVKYFVKLVNDRYNAEEVRVSRESEVLVSYKVQP